MKTLSKPITLLSFLFALIFAGNPQAGAALTEKVPVPATIDSSDIRAYIESGPELLYPLATERIYMRGKYKPVWFSSVPTEQFWDAMMLLDCSVQYGLDHHDYHAADLSYSKLKEILNKNDVKLAAKIDVLLTDAMLAFISHLHYGKLAQVYTPPTTDQADFKGFRADSALIGALKSVEFTVSITGAQPGNKEYQDLQHMLGLLTGQYAGDSYETSIETVKIISLNLERWRWEKPTQAASVFINIPAFSLRYNKDGEYQQFKVIVGKPTTHTPILSSAIGYFTTAPDWTVPGKILVNELLPLALKYPDYLDKNNFRIYDKKGNTICSDPINLRRLRSNIADYIVKQSPGCDNALGRIAFNFPNNYNVYLHDTPDRELFKRSDRALSHGCIRLENPEEFANLLLKGDRAPQKTFAELHEALANYQRKRFTLITPVPILVRYFTCEVNDGMLITYKDLYKKDKEVSDRLFGSDDFLAMEVKEFVRKKTEGFANIRSAVVKR